MKADIKRFEKYFSPRELFPKEMIQSLPGHYLWGWLDEGLICALTTLREIAGFPLMINSGGLQYSGFRPASSLVGSPYSAHRIGKAVDIKTRSQVEMAILIEIVKADGFWMGFTEMEDPEYTPGWLHLSTRGTGLNELKIITP